LPDSKPPVAQRIAPGSFEPQQHFYPRTLNAQLHPQLRFFLSLGNARIAARYAHLHPEVSPDAIHEALSFIPRHFHWGGADLFHVATGRGVRRMIVIETNSSPSGQKSMPIPDDAFEQAGYEQLMARTFLRLLRQRGLPTGGLAVIYDKNEMECSGYAAALADQAEEPVWLVPMPDGAADPIARFDQSGTLQIRDPEGAWHPMRAAMRYVTQRPWNRIPPVTRTQLCNPVLVCLAGGRNKLLAAKAYDFHNAELEPTGLRIRTPDTIWDVAREEVPLWVARMGGFAVVKVPYANAGQGIYTITSPAELDAFMDESSGGSYERYVVQALVGNSGWSSRSPAGTFYHVGTVPDRRGRIYVADLRFMVGVDEQGFYPVALYARRARRPLTDQLAEGAQSWDMLGTNLSVRRPDGLWDTESERLLLVDERDYNRLGLGLDDLIEGYLQTVLSMSAIDRMAQRLLTTRGSFRRKLFASLTPDPSLAAEIAR
jgi:hypothetical protein